MSLRFGAIRLEWLVLSALAVVGCARADNGFGDTLVTDALGDDTSTSESGSDGGIDVRMDAPADTHATDAHDAADAMVPDGAVRCTADRDCTQPTAPHCDTSVGYCVQCIPGGARVCAAGYFCTPMRACEAGCAVDADCAVPGGTHTLTCDTTFHRCTGCLGDSDCNLGSVCTGGNCVAGCNTTHVCPFGSSCCSSVCVNTSSDPSHCGSCTNVCAAIHGTAACNAGMCSIACSTGFADCDHNASNGCEADTLTSAMNCGGCMMPCTAANGTGGCMMGSCVLSSCNAGYQDCDRMAPNGCEANTLTDAMNCGLCGHACAATEVCSGGTCTCPSGYMRCGAVCINVRSDAMNCGTCGAACASGQWCSGGICTTAMAGAAVFTTPGTTMFTVPAGVHAVNVVVVGAGGSGTSGTSAIGGGGGGGLCYLNDMLVTPGASIPVVVGAGGTLGNAGGSSSFNATLVATGGGGTRTATGAMGGSGMGGTCFTGGSGGSFMGTGSFYHAAGGGAAGYSGNGGQGSDSSGSMCENTSTAGAGGGGGGGGTGCDTAHCGLGYGAGGGGVGLTGAGANGVVGTSTCSCGGWGTAGGGGSGGVNGSAAVGSGAGGAYGGGGGSGAGAPGAVRVIWGPGRSYPSNAM